MTDVAQLLALHQAGFLGHRALVRGLATARSSGPLQPPAPPVSEVLVEPSALLRNHNGIRP